MTTIFTARYPMAAIRIAALAGIALLGSGLQPNPSHAASMTGPLPSDNGLLTGPSPGSLLAEPPPGTATTPAAPEPGPSEVPKKPVYSETDAPILLSVGDLADFCASKPSDTNGVAKRNICLGFTLGVIAVAERQQASGGTRVFCTPKPTFDINETMDRFVQLAQTQPIVRSSPVIDGLVQFLQLRFPCK